MVSKTLNKIAKYFKQFSNMRGLLKLILALLVMACSFKLNAGYVHPCDNCELALFFTSGLVPFFLITIIPKVRYSLPLSFITIILFYFLLRNIALSQV